MPAPVPSSIPSNTPQIVTPTPVILPVSTVNITATTSSLPPFTPTNTSTNIPANIQTETQTPVQSVNLEILGCDTGFDVQNGMFEVTNAYVTIKNTGNIDLENTCALLRANDEGREHPDKQVCAGILPVKHQVTLKLTVDSTYQNNTVIQVDVTTNEFILLRLDKQSCRDINVFGQIPTDLGVIKPTE